jgi:NADH:ubiquinone oxidoreductase subunit F (NADH-binding)
VIDEIDAAGLRGRGGAGFPTGTKWRTVREVGSDVLPTTVIVNGAEGEPGTFKDHTILLNNPYQVIEGALIAATVVSGGEVVLALKAAASDVVRRVRAAVAEMDAAGVLAPITVRVFEGPGEYLYGEETALLEALNGRPPFPRITPPYRRGAVDVVLTDDEAASGSGQSALVEMADGNDAAPPALIDNVETMANVPGIVLHGAAWFRECGTEQSPGTIVCTVSGGTESAGVGEFEMGTPLREVIETLGGAEQGRPVKAVMPGVSNSIIPAAALDTALTYESMAQLGSGLGSAGFIVLTEGDDMVAVAAGASRFLAVESCGQCTPCKRDGLALSELLARLARNEATIDDVAEIRDLARMVSEEARCSLANQHEAIVTSLFDEFDGEVAPHVNQTAPAAEPMFVAEILGVTDGLATLDESRRGKQPDWSFDETDSGKRPVERLAEHRDHATQ